MTFKPVVRISDQRLIVKDRTILAGLPDNVIVTSASSSGHVEGIFLVAVFNGDSSSHVVPLGTLHDVRSMACLRLKLWWQKMGYRVSEIPLKTQFLLVETKEGFCLNGVDEDEEDRVVYTIFLPLIEMPFQACLQGNADNQLELCLQGGDLDVTASTFTHSVFVHTGMDPFQTVFDAVTVVKSHLKTICLRHEKKPLMNDLNVLELTN